jgi:hypothetical protein
VAIDHYSKWCEIKAMMDRDVKIIAKVLESEVIYRAKFFILTLIML